MGSRPNKISLCYIIRERLLETFINRSTISTKLSHDIDNLKQFSGNKLLISFIGWYGVMSDDLWNYCTCHSWPAFILFHDKDVSGHKTLFIQKCPGSQKTEHWPYAWYHRKCLSITSCSFLCHQILINTEFSLCKSFILYPTTPNTSWQTLLLGLI